MPSLKNILLPFFLLLGNFSQAQVADTIVISDTLPPIRVIGCYFGPPIHELSIGRQFFPFRFGVDYTEGTGGIAIDFLTRTNYFLSAGFCLASHSRWVGIQDTLLNRPSPHRGVANYYSFALQAKVDFLKLMGIHYAFPATPYLRLRGGLTWVEQGALVSYDYLVNTDYRPEPSLYPNVGASLGVQYYPLYKWGLFAEGGWGISSYFSLGLLHRWGYP